MSWELLKFVAHPAAEEDEKESFDSSVSRARVNTGQVVE